MIFFFLLENYDFHQLAVCVTKKKFYHWVVSINLHWMN